VRHGDVVMDVELRTHRLSLQTAHHAARAARVDRYGAISKESASRSECDEPLPSHVSTSLYGSRRDDTFLWFADL
jgi:hypothetical protein